MARPQSSLRGVAATTKGFGENTPEAIATARMINFMVSLPIDKVKSLLFHVAA